MIRVIHHGIRLYLDPDDILYASRPDDDSDVVARTQGGALALPCKTSLVKLAQEYQQLVLIHRNSLVRRDYIKSVVCIARKAEGCTVILKNDVQLHGSRRFYQEWTA